MGGIHMCCVCGADIHTLPYSHVHADATWIPTQYTHAQFLRRWPDCCAIFRVPGVTKDVIAFDTMHNKHLGMDQYFLASVLYVLVYLMLPGTIPHYDARRVHAK